MLAHGTIVASPIIDCNNADKGPLSHIHCSTHFTPTQEIKELLRTFGIETGAPKANTFGMLNTHALLVLQPNLPDADHQYNKVKQNLPVCVATFTHSTAAAMLVSASSSMTITSFLNDLCTTAAITRPSWLHQNIYVHVCMYICIYLYVFIYLAIIMAIVLYLFRYMTI